MRHRFLAATVAILLVGLVSGQLPFRNGFQSPNYASFGNGPQAPVNYGNLQNFAPYNQASSFSNSGYGVPNANVPSNPAAGQASGAASASFHPQISNQPQNINFQYANSFANPVGPQLSPVEYMRYSLENDPIIRPYLQGPTSANPVTNGAQLFRNSQNRFPISYSQGSNPLSNVNPPYTVPAGNAASGSFFPQFNNQPPTNNLQYMNSFPKPVGSQLSPAEYMRYSLQNDPLLKPYLQGPTSANPVINGAQLIQNSHNGFPIPYVTGSNPLPNVNPGPGNNAASLSFYPQNTYQPQVNNFRSPNSFVNPADSQLSSNDVVMNTLENNPIIKQFPQGSTNPVINGAQFIQNPQNSFPNTLPNSPNVKQSDSVLSSLESNPIINDFLNNPARQRQVFNQAPTNQQLVNNQAPNTLPNRNASDDVLDFLEKMPLIKQILDNPANQQPVNNQAPNGLPNANSPVNILDLQKKNPLIKQFLNYPENQRRLRNRNPQLLNPRRPPFSIRPDSFQNSNSWTNADNYNADEPTNSPTLSSFRLTGDSSNNPIPSGVPALFASTTDKPFTPYVPLEYPKSDFPEGFFDDMLKSLGTNSKSASTVAAVQPKRRRKCKVKPGTRTDNSSKGPVSAGTASTKMPSSDSFNLFTLNNIATVNQVTDSIFPDSSQTDTKLTTENQSDMLKQFTTLSNIKVIDFLGASKTPSARKRKCRKRPKIKATDLVSKTPNYSDLTSSGTLSVTTPASLPLMFTPQIDNTKGVTVTDFMNTNQNSDLTTGKSIISDSSQADTKLTTIYPSDTLKQFTISNIKVIDSLGAPKAPSKRKRKCRKRPKMKVTDLVTKTPNYSDLTAAVTSASTPQIANSKSVTITDFRNTNQNSDLTTTGLIGLQPRKKKKCNKNRVKPKAESNNSQNDLLKEQYDTVPSFIGKGVTDSLNLSTAGNTDTNFRRSDKRQKSKKCQRKKGRMKAAVPKGLPTVSISGSTDVITAGITKQDGTTTGSPKTTKIAVKSTTIGSGLKITDETSIPDITLPVTFDVTAPQTVTVTTDTSETKKATIFDTDKATTVAMETTKADIMTTKAQENFPSTEVVTTVNVKTDKASETSVTEEENVSAQSEKTATHQKTTPPTTTTRIETTSETSKFQEKNISVVTEIAKAITREDKLTTAENKKPAVETTVSNIIDSTLKNEVTMTEIHTGTESNNKIYITTTINSESAPSNKETTAKRSEITSIEKETTKAAHTATVTPKFSTTPSDPCGEDEKWWVCKPLNNTCTNVARSRSQKNPICEPGCYCADDLVKDVDGTCVDPDECKDPVCRDEDHEESTDCLVGCNRCEDDCHKPCKMQSCVSGCDCKDGFKRDGNGICVLDLDCPPCPTVPTVSSGPTVPTLSSGPTVPSVSSGPTVPTVSSGPTVPNVSSGPTVISD